MKRTLFVLALTLCIAFSVCAAADWQDSMEQGIAAYGMTEGFAVIDASAAFEWFDKAAEEGGAEAMLALGDLFLSGEKVYASREIALQWYQKAADAGSAEAFFRMGEMHFEEGAYQDYAQARKCFEEGASLGHEGAQDMLAKMDEQELGLHEMTAEEKAAKGHSLYQMWDFAAARQLYEEALAAGSTDADAMNNLAYIYDTGMDGTQPDYEKAALWYTRAAELGKRDAMYSLALLYYNGTGVQQDLSMALSLFEQSGELGFGMAMSNAAIMYQYGQGTQINLEKAVYWYEQAVQAGRPEAMVELGVLYYNGNGVEQSYVMARRLFEEAAALGNPQAANNVAVMDNLGQGLEE